MLYDAAPLVPNIGIKYAHRRPTDGRSRLDCMHGRTTAATTTTSIYGGDFDVKWRIGALAPTTHFCRTSHRPLRTAHIFRPAAGNKDYKGRDVGQIQLRCRNILPPTPAHSAPLQHRLSIGLGYMWGQNKGHTPIIDHDVVSSADQARPHTRRHIARMGIRRSDI